MENKDWILLWLAVGLVYTIINGLFRKNVNTDGDWLLVMAWIMFGPFFVCLLFGRTLYRKLKR